MGVTITQEMIDGARRTENTYGIPTSITLGQLMLESGGDYEGGLSGLAYNYNNFFGVTAGSSWTGETVYMTNKNGTDGQYYRVYDSVSDSILDHGKVLMNNRYTQYTNDATTIEEYAQGIKDGGYATDPNYVSKLMNVINSNNLTSYDLGTWKTGATGTTINGSDIYIPDGSTNATFTESNNGSSTTSESQDLKWWGDIVIIIITILLIGLAVLFFVMSFNGGKMPTPSNMIMNKLKLPKGKGVNENE